MNLPEIILSQLVCNEEYTRKCIPFMSDAYFEKREHYDVFRLIKSYIDKYNTIPQKNALFIDLANDDDAKGRFSEDYIGILVSTISRIYKNGADDDGNCYDLQWLVDKTEEWCKQRAISNAIIESVAILDKTDKENRTPHAIPRLLEDALSVSFDQHIGHSYTDNFDERYEFYHRDEEKYPFDIDLLNKITNGGLTPKTLSLLILQTGGGKSAIKCHFAARYLMQQRNVLYITMEMAEEKIAERIDANLMNVPIQHLKKMDKKVFDDRMSDIRGKTKGRLYIKQFPTGSAHVGHFRALLNDLKQKKRFVPDVIIVDYLNICASSRIKGLGGSVNTYSYVKSIAEEMRGLAIETNTVVISSTQSNRSAANASDVGMENISESYGTAATVDFLLAGIVTEELVQQNQIMFKQLKNRYNDPQYYNKFIVGFDRSRMKLYDIDDGSSNSNNNDDDNSTNGASSSSSFEQAPIDFSGFDV